MTKVMKHSEFIKDSTKHVREHADEGLCVVDDATGEPKYRFSNPKLTAEDFVGPLELNRINVGLDECVMHDDNCDGEILIVCDNYEEDGDYFCDSYEICEFHHRATSTLGGF